GEIKPARPREVCQRLRLEYVDSHADGRRHTRLLGIGLDAVAPTVFSHVEHPVIDLNSPFVRRDREDVPVPAVIAKERGVIECGQHVAVHHDEGLVETRVESKRSRRSKRLFLLHVRDVDAVVIEVAAYFMYEMRELPDTERD